MLWLKRLSQNLEGAGRSSRTRRLSGGDSGLRSDENGGAPACQAQSGQRSAPKVAGPHPSHAGSGLSRKLLCRPGSRAVRGGAAVEPPPPRCFASCLGAGSRRHWGALMVPGRRQRQRRREDDLSPGAGCRPGPILHCHRTPATPEGLHGI